MSTEYFLYVGVQYIQELDVGGCSDVTAGPATAKRTRRSASGGLAERANSSASATTASPDALPSTSTAYAMQVFSAQCKYWNTYTKEWTHSGCTVGSLTRVNRTHCICNHLSPPPPDGDGGENTTDSLGDSLQSSAATTTAASATRAAARSARNAVVSSSSSSAAPTVHGIAFGSGIVLPINTINLADSAFNHLDENPVAFAVMVSMMCIYSCALIWAKKKDQLDAVKAGTTPLLDNNPRDRYLYELTVYTGNRARAGTTAKVSMIVAGDLDETPPRLIYDDKRPVLQRGGVDTFLMAVPAHLGSLSHIRVWHDNSGPRPAWFFSRLQIIDLQSKDSFFFIVDRWLAADEGDSTIDRVVPLAGKEEMTQFGHLFFTKTKKDLLDGHLWFSVVGRPHKSSFTRCQRLTACLSLVFSLMLSNILFYQTNDSSSDSTRYSFTIGSITITVNMLLRGFISSLVTLPINLIVVLIFRKAKKRTVLKRTSASAAAKTGTLYAIGNAKEGQLNGDEQKQQRNKRKKRRSGFKIKFPWWSVYVAYGLCLASCAVSFWAVVEIAGNFGAPKAERWLASFLVSLAESICFSQPVKVIGVALFFALFIKKPATDDFADSGLEKGQEYLHQHIAAAASAASGGAKDAMSRYKSIPIPPSEEYLRGAREKRVKELQMLSVIKEIAAYFGFVFLVMMIIYGNSMPLGRQLVQSLTNQLQHGLFTQTQWEATDMAHVKTLERMVEWLEKTLVPTAYPGSGHLSTGLAYDWAPGYGVDGATVLVGQPRLRQLRSTSEPCPPSLLKLSKTCRPKYSLLSKETQNFTTGWRLLNDSADLSVRQAAATGGWTYQSASDLGGVDFSGDLSDFDGGGYVINLGLTADSARQKCVELMESGWLDLLTRAVFVEFSLYSPSERLLVWCTVRFEFPATGAAMSNLRVQLLQLDKYSTTFMLVVLAFEILTFVATLFFTIKEFRAFCCSKGDYWSFWSVTEVVSLAMFIITTAVYFCSLLESQAARRRFISDRTGFTNFTMAATWSEAYNLLLGFLAFICTIKFLKLLRFNKRIGIFGRMLKLIARPLASFMVVFGLFFVLFAMVFMLVYSSQLNSFRSPSAACQYTLTLMLNKFNYEDMIEAGAAFGLVLFFAYIVGNNFVLVSFMMTLIMDGFSQTQEAVAQEKNRFELVEFVSTKFKEWLGVRATAADSGLGYHSHAAAAELHDPDDWEPKMTRLDEAFTNYIAASLTTVEEKRWTEEYMKKHELEQRNAVKAKKIVLVA